MNSDVDALKAEVQKVIIVLECIAKSSFPVQSFGDSYKKIGLNFSLRACEIAAEITGADRTFCKMLNHRFRMDAAELMFESAMANPLRPEAQTRGLL